MFSLDSFRFLSCLSLCKQDLFAMFGPSAHDCHTADCHKLSRLVHLQRCIRRHTFRAASPRSTGWKVPATRRAMPLEAAVCDSLVAVEKVGHRRERGSATLNHSAKGPTLNVVLRFSEDKGPARRLYIAPKVSNHFHK